MKNDNHNSNNALKHCALMSSLISLSYDKPLDTRQKLMLQTHLLMCPSCRNFAKNSNALQQMMRQFKALKR